MDPSSPHPTLLAVRSPAILATLLDTGETVEALTLWTVPSDRRGGLPSRRYRNLVADGAEQRGLPAPYVARLRALPVYKPNIVR